MCITSAAQQLLNVKQLNGGVYFRETFFFRIGRKVIVFNVDLVCATIREEVDSKRVDNVRTLKSLNLPVQSVLKEELSVKYAHFADVPFIGIDRTAPRILIGIDHQWKLGMPSKIVEAGWD